MTATYSMQATVREKAGKGAARAARRQGNVPAVIYGDKQTPVMINIAERELIRHLATTFFTHIFELNIDGKKHSVLPRDVQFNPVTDRPEHVDFMRVGKGTKITVRVPIDFKNHEKSPGLKAGGVLNMVFHDLEVRCAANDIPEHITIDLSGAEVGQSIHLSHIALPKGVEAVGHDQDPTIATIAAPAALKSDKGPAAAEPAAAAAPAADKK